MKRFYRTSLSLLVIGLLADALAAQGPVATAPLFDEAAPAVSFEPEPRGDASGAGFFGGAGLYLIQANFQNNPAYTVFTQTTVDKTLDPKNPNSQTIGETARRVEVNHSMVAAPLIWLGYANETGFGGRARGWGFQEGTSQSVSLAPFAGKFKVGGSGGETVIVADGTLATVSSAAPLGLQAFGDTLSVKYGPEAATLAVTTKLAVQVYDLEAMQLYGGSEWTFGLFGGARYVRLDQSYNAYDFQSGNPGAFRTLVSNYDFQGVGPTLAFELKRQIAESGLSLYGNGRGSLVFGSANQSAAFFGKELRNDDPNPQIASQNRDRALPILDFEAGVEYGRAVGRAWLFGQVGVVGQEWFNAGSSSRSTLLNVANTPRPVLGGAPLDSNIEFLGLTVRVGVNY